MTEVTRKTLFIKKPSQAPNLAHFVEWMAEWKTLTFYYPNHEKAPWLVHCRVEDRYSVVINFWPHKQKAQAENSSVHQGPNAYDDAMRDALELASDAHDVVDDDDVE